MNIITSGSTWFPKLPTFTSGADIIEDLGDIQFIIDYDGTQYTIPINPEELSIVRPGKNETRDIISGKTIVLPRNREPIDISISCFFPRYKDTITNIPTYYSFKGTDTYKELFETIQENKDYCRLIITGYNISMLVVIEDLTWTYEAPDYENLYYSIDFKEYTPYGIKLIEVEQKVEEDTTTVTITEPDNPDDTTNKEVVIGSQVWVTGQLHADSYGGGPGKSFNDVACTVNITAKERSHPYHVVADDGVSGTGWVLESAVRLR